MPDKQTAWTPADPMENTENRAMDADNDSASPERIRAEENAIVRDPELSDETPQTYEQEVDNGGETPSGKHTGPDEAWDETLPGPNAH